MAKKESSLKNMIISLTVITVVSGGILGFVYGLTKDAIAKVEQQKNEKAISEVLTKEGVSISNIETITIDELTYNNAYDGNGNYIGSAVKTFSSGFNGRIELMVGIMNDGTLNKVSVLSQSETPGLGANMTGKFKDQFSGKNTASYRLAVSKDGNGDVDAITAATISSRAFCKAVQTAVDGLNANKAQFVKTVEVTEEQPIEGGNENE